MCILYTRRKHEKGHTADKPYWCQTCGRNFASDEELHKHNERAHMVEKSYKCKTCDKSFARPNYLKWHEKQHMGSKRFTCGECNEGFPKKLMLIDHMKVHAGNVVGHEVMGPLGARYLILHVEKHTLLWQPFNTDGLFTFLFYVSQNLKISQHTKLLQNCNWSNWYRGLNLWF